MNATKTKKKKSKPQPWRILIASGVNLDLLGMREPHLYGSQTLADMEALLQSEFGEIAELNFFQIAIKPHDRFNRVYFQRN